MWGILDDLWICLLSPHEDINPHATYAALTSRMLIKSTCRCCLKASTKSIILLE